MTASDGGQWSALDINSFGVEFFFGGEGMLENCTCLPVI